MSKTQENFFTKDKSSSSANIAFKDLKSLDE